MDNELQKNPIIDQLILNVNNVMQDKIKYSALVLLATVFAFSGCKKLYNLPDEKDYLSTQADYTTKDFQPYLGRTNLYTNIFNPNGSTRQ